MKKRLKSLFIIMFLLVGFSLSSFYIYITTDNIKASDNVSKNYALLEEKRKSYEKAFSEYEASAAEENHATNELENIFDELTAARKVLKALNEKYTYDFTGFLSYVIDNEKDPAKKEDAQKVLSSILSSKDNEGVNETKANEPSNIYRMLYTVKWLNEYNDFFAQYSDKGVTISTSHYMMYNAQSNLTTAIKNSEKMSETDGSGINSTRSKYSQLRYLNTYAAVDENNNPFLIHSDDEISRSKPLKLTEYPWGWLLEGGSVLAEGGSNFLVGLACGVNPTDNENVSLDIFDSGKGTYTLDEYAKAINSYCDLLKSKNEHIELINNLEKKENEAKTKKQAAHEIALEKREAYTVAYNEYFALAEQMGVEIQAVTDKESSKGCDEEDGPGCGRDEPLIPVEWTSNKSNDSNVFREAYSDVTTKDDEEGIRVNRKIKSSESNNNEQTIKQKTKFQDGVKSVTKKEDIQQNISPDIQNNKKETDKVPQTGDKTYTFEYVLCTLIAIATIYVVIKRYKKQKNGNKKID